MKIKKTLTLAVPFAILCSIYILVEHCFFDLSRINAIRYMVSQCLVILLPGLVLTKYLLGNKITSIIHWITISYALGYAFNILEYFIIYGFRLQKNCTVIVVIITIMALALWFYKPIEVELRKISQQDYITLFVFGLYLLICIISYSGNNISPFVGQHKTSINRDVQFWCSNAVALKLQFTPQSAYFAGARLYYHYFSSLHIAFISQVSGLSVFDVAFTLYPFGKCILLVGGLDYLLDRYELGLRKFFYMACMLFMTGWETISVVTYNWHLTEDPFGFDIGFAFGIWFIAFFFAQIEEKEFDIRKFISTMLMWMVCVGAKAPVAVVIIFIPGIVCVMWLLYRKFKLAFGYGLSILGLFAAINIWCAGIIRILDKTAEGFDKYNERTFRSIYEVISQTPYDVRYRNTLRAIVYLGFRTHPALFVISMIDLFVIIVLVIRKKVEKKLLFEIAVSFCSMIVGFVLGLFYITVGHSEMYFCMASYIPCIMFNILIGKALFPLYQKYQIIGGIRIVYNFILIFLLLLGVMCWLIRDYDGGMLVSLNNGISKIEGRWSYENDKVCQDEETQAYQWLRRNSKYSSIVASNRCLEHSQESFYASIFSEREQYLETTDCICYCDLGVYSGYTEAEETERRKKLLLSAFSGSKNAVKQLKKENVSYLIQDDSISDDKLKRMGLRVVYNENEIVIYAL